jgi:hypothetical protein
MFRPNFRLSVAVEENRLPRLGRKIYVRQFVSILTKAELLTISCRHSLPFVSTTMVSTLCSPTHFLIYTTGIMKYLIYEHKTLNIHIVICFIIHRHSVT